MNKVSLGARVYNIAEQYGIEQTKVHMIINTYIDYCKYRVIHGYRVDILGLASLVPNRVVSNYKYTLAYECNFIADYLKLPQYTVFVIINEYINSCIDDIMSGKNVVLRGLFSVFPIRDDTDKVVKAQSSISSQLKKYLAEEDTCVTSIRVHTHKFLKYNIKVS